MPVILEPLLFPEPIGTQKAGPQSSLAAITEFTRERSFERSALKEGDAERPQRELRDHRTPDGARRAREMKGADGYFVDVDDAAGELRNASPMDDLERRARAASEGQLGLQHSKSSGREMEERLPSRVRFEDSSDRARPERDGAIATARGWQEHDTLEKVSLLNQESSPPNKRWRTKSLDMGRGRGAALDSAGSLWRRTNKETMIEMDPVNASVGASPYFGKKGSLPHLPETHIYSQSECEMSTNNSAMSSMRGFSQVDTDSTNSSQRLPTLLSQIPPYTDPVADFSEGVELGSLRMRKTSSHSSQRHSFRDEELVVKASAVPASQYNRAKSRFAEPRKPSEFKSGSPRKSGVIRSGQQRRSGNLWSGQLKSQMLKSGMLPMQRLDEEEEDPFKGIDLPDRPKSQKKLTWGSCFEWVALIVLLGAVVCSRVIAQVNHVTLWGLLLWKWFLLALVMVCGRLVSGFVVRILVFVLEVNFLTRRRVLYFVYALRRSVRNCIWLALVLISWNSMFDSKAQATSTKLVYVTKVLQCFLLAACLWLVKVLLVKVLASSFHVDTYFERIRDSLFNQHVLEVLSGPPVLELQQMQEDDEKLMDEVAMLKQAGATAPGLTGLPGIRESMKNLKHEKTFNRTKTGVHSGEIKAGSGVTVEHLHKLNRKNVSAFNMKRLINMVRYNGVATLGQGMDNAALEDQEGMDTEIRSEWQAKAVAKEIFENVPRPGVSYITEDDLIRFMPEEDAIRALALFDGAMETGKITKKALKSWVVNVYQERRALALSLSDTKSAVSKLHRMIDIILLVAVVVLWLLILGVATTALLAIVSSQVIVLVFIFGNTLKTVFEAIVFVFVYHPFDVGDRCVIDGVTYVVEEMNILTTVFLGDFNAKVWYPNSVLATKPITNYYRSPDMGDMFEFFIDITTTAEKIGKLKEAIGRYISSKPQHWKEDVALNCMDCALDTGRLKLVVGLTHTMNYHNIGEKTTRKTELIFEMKRLFQDLGIQYHLPPQEMHMKSIPGTTINLSRSP